MMTVQVAPMYLPAMPTIPSAAQRVPSLSPRSSCYDLPTLHLSGDRAMDREARVMRCLCLLSFMRTCHCVLQTLLVRAGPGLYDSGVLEKGNLSATILVQQSTHVWGLSRVRSQQS